MRSPTTRGLADVDLTCLFGGVLARVRWVALVALMLLALVQPLPGRLGMPTWGNILIFIGYNVLLELLHRRVALLRSFGHTALLDLLIVAILYAFSAAPGGPIFVLFLLITTCAAASMSLRSSLLYTAAVAVIVAVLAPTLPFWMATTWQVRELGAQVIVILLVGVGTALLTRQIAREQVAAQTSRSEAERLAELDRLRDEFIATISHDLRTPLTATKAGLGMLESSAIDRLQPQEQRLLQTIQRNVARLDRHVADLLAVNQLQAGVLRLDCEPIDVRTVVTDAMSAVLPLVQEHDQTLELDLPVALPVNGDPWRLEQVVLNLLCNAQQHTPAGTRILVSGRTTDTTVILTVSDTGPGIPPAAQMQLFERFQRGATSARGSGLGLAIVKGIIALHEGVITVTSTPGQGATFRITLPRYGGDGS